MLYQYIGFTSNHYASIKEMADQAQREIIERVASEGSCVIVGRRADLILKDNPNILRIFITASTKTREQRIAERDRLSEANSRKKLPALTVRDRRITINIPRKNGATLPVMISVSIPINSVLTELLNQS